MLTFYFVIYYCHYVEITVVSQTFNIYTNIV